MTRNHETTAAAAVAEADAPLTISLDEAFAPYAPELTPELEKFDRELQYAYSFQRRLLELRTSLGLNQAQAGALVGEHQTEISRMERGRFTPSYARGARILAGLERAVAERRVAAAVVVPEREAVQTPTYYARRIADYFLSIQDQEDPITNLKLQKLLYFAKGTCLATRRTPLFRDHMLAWQHGPVVPAVWREYARYKGDPLPAPTDFDPATIDAETRGVLDVVYRRWGRYAAFTLRDMTHQQGPWKDTERNAELSDEALAAYFGDLLTPPAAPVGGSAVAVARGQ